MEKSKHEYICEGCDLVSEDRECTVYEHVPSNYIRLGCCAFNRQRVLPRKGPKVRVGQQKQRKGLR